jgi:hypothetical protein
MGQLEFPFVKQERIRDIAQDLYAWLMEVGTNLYTEQAERGRKLVDSLWEEVGSK